MGRQRRTRPSWVVLWSETLALLVSWRLVALRPSHLRNANKALTSTLHRAIFCRARTYASFHSCGRSVQHFKATAATPPKSAANQPAGFALTHTADLIRRSVTRIERMGRGSGPELTAAVYLLYTRYIPAIYPPYLAIGPVSRECVAGIRWKRSERAELGDAGTQVGRTRSSVEGRATTEADRIIRIGQTSAPGPVSRRAPCDPQPTGAAR